MMIIKKEVHGCCDRIDDRAEALVGGYEEFVYASSSMQHRWEILESKQGSLS